jgi:hypothetical protein
MARYTRQDHEAFLAWAEPWYAKIKAAYGKPQYIQNRISRAFHAAAEEREAGLRAIREAEELAERRAANAARMRESRAQAKARSR